MHVALKANRRAEHLVAIEAACGAGAIDSGCKHGPLSFRQHWEKRTNADGLQLIWELMPEHLCVETATPLDTVARFSRWLAAVTRRIARKGSRFVVIGGDHSCAIGTWSGVSNAIRHEGALGLIWIDAHLDMHVPETTHSGAINGMPVAALLGYGPPELTGLAEGCPAIDPKNICLLGARSFEPEEIDFSQRHGVRVIAMEEISRRGLEDALAEARAIASDGTAGYGVSLDLDAFDPTDAPGVGTAVPDGIDAGRFLNAWKGLTCASACRGIEIVEYNPFRDRADRTAQLLSNLLTEMVVEETYHG